MFNDHNFEFSSSWWDVNSEIKTVMFWAEITIKNWAIALFTETAIKNWVVTFWEETAIKNWMIDCEMKIFFFQLISELYFCNHERSRTRS